MNATLNLSRGNLVCSELNFIFPLLLNLPGEGLLDGVSFYDSYLCVSSGVISNISSLVNYTAMDGFSSQIP